MIIAAGVAVLLVVAVGAGLTIGPVQISLTEFSRILAGWVGVGAVVDGPAASVVTAIRLPRVVLGLLIGAVLGVAGASLQGLFRNPLADPGLIGISAGAALAAVAVLVLGERFLPATLLAHALPLAAFAGGLIATLLIYRISVRDGHPVVATMLLAGIAVNAFAGAATGFLTFLATDQQIRDLTFWSLGSLGGATWCKLAIGAPMLLLAIFVLPLAARPLNALLLGEAEAGHLGFDTVRTKFLVILCCALGVGAAVALAGIIGFVGLVIPHLVRMMAGPDHRFLLPVSAALGSALLVGADLAARCLVAPAELPIGVLTAAIGAPFFLWLLVRSRGGAGL